MPQSPFGRNTFRSSKAREHIAHANNLIRRLEIEADPGRRQWIRDEAQRLADLAKTAEEEWQRTIGEKRKKQAEEKKRRLEEKKRKDAERKQREAEKKANAKPVGRQQGQRFPGGYMTEKKRKALEAEQQKKSNGK